MLYLVPDVGGGLLPAITLGGAGATNNSQCAVIAAGSSAIGSGNTLTLTLNMTFTAAFGGNKIVYMAARDVSANNSGWAPLGVWQVPGAPQTTTTAVLGMTPASGSGLTGTQFTFNFSDSAGYRDFGVLNILINSALDGRHACYMAFVMSQYSLYLMDDAGDALLQPGRFINGPDGFNNSQCVVSWSLPDNQASGNGLTNFSITLNIRLAGGFGPDVVFYLAARDKNENNNTGWQSMGTWRVQ